MRIFLTLILTVVMSIRVFGEGACPRVSIVTFYPGSEVYELAGHTALRVVDPQSWGDMMFNWGTFDFNAPNFLYRFVKGETDYRLEAVPSELFLRHYTHSRRRIVEQEIGLDSAQTSSLIALLADNLRPENRVYRYNYVLDNCATRPLRILERAIGDTILLTQNTHVQDTTFRQVMKRYHVNYPWYQFGIDLALGNGIDRKINVRERAFAPVEMMSSLADATTGHSDSHIVVATTILNEGYKAKATLPPTPLLLTPLFWCWAFFAAAALVSWRDISRGHLSRWFDSMMYSFYALAGLVLTFLIFVSTHEATSPNWNYLWLNPLCLISAIGVWFKRGHFVVYSWQFLNFAFLITLCVLAMSGVQALNTAFWPLILADLLRSVIYIHITRCNVPKRHCSTTD